MNRENPLWGAPRIHGELLKLGFELAESTVSKYMIRRRRPPSQSWRTFLRNLAYAAAHVRVASCDAGRANDGRADAHGSLGHHNDDEVRAPCPVHSPIRDRHAESENDGWRGFWATGGQPMATSLEKGNSAKNWGVEKTR